MFSQLAWDSREVTDQESKLLTGHNIYEAFHTHGWSMRQCRLARNDHTYARSSTASSKDISAIGSIVILSSSHRTSCNTACKLAKVLVWIILVSLWAIVWLSTALISFVSSTLLRYTNSSKLYLWSLAPQCLVRWRMSFLWPYLRSILSGRETRYLHGCFCGFCIIRTERYEYSLHPFGTCTACLYTHVHIPRPECLFDCVIRKFHLRHESYTSDRLLCWWLYSSLHSRSRQCLSLCIIMTDDIVDWLCSQLYPATFHASSAPVIQAVCVGWYSEPVAFRHTFCQLLEFSTLVTPPFDKRALRYLSVDQDICTPAIFVSFQYSMDVTIDMIRANM